MTEQPDRVRYQEAFPRFDMRRARAALKKGLEICQYVDNFGRTVGHARMASENATHFTLEYQFASPLFPMAHNTIDLELAPTNDGVDFRRMILCPTCGKRKSVIVCVGIWNCASCHELNYRIQYLSKNTILWEKMNSLKKEVGYGRPKGMHTTTYKRLRQKYVGLCGLLKGKVVPDVSEAHSYVVGAKWRKFDAGDNWEIMDLRDGETY